MLGWTGSGRIPPREVLRREVLGHPARQGQDEGTWEVRWKVGYTPYSRSLSNRAQADNFLSELRQAARKGEPFETDTGLPD